MSEQANVLWYKKNHDLWDFLTKHHYHSTNIQSLRPLSSKEQSQVKAHLLHGSLLGGRSAVNDTKRQATLQDLVTPQHISVRQQLTMLWIIRKQHNHGAKLA